MRKCLKEKDMCVYTYMYVHIYACFCINTSRVYICKYMTYIHTSHTQGGGGEKGRRKRETASLRERIIYIYNLSFSPSLSVFLCE